MSEYLQLELPAIELFKRLDYDYLDDYKVKEEKIRVFEKLI